MGHPCQTCGKVFLSSGLQQHMMRCEPGLVKHECSLCKNYFTIAELQQHFDICPCCPLREYSTFRRPQTADHSVQRSSRPHTANSAINTRARPVDQTGRVRCAHCGRGFAPDRVHVHERACRSGQSSRRGVYDSAAHRLSDIPPSMRGSPRPVSQGMRRRGDVDRGNAKKTTKTNWRAEHAAFQAMIRSARMASGMGSSSPSPYGKVTAPAPPQASDHRETCPHCSRKFAPSTAERHIPACARAYARPAPPPSLRPQTSSSTSSWAPWLTQAGQPVHLSGALAATRETFSSAPLSAFQASLGYCGTPGGSPPSSPYRSYASSKPVAVSRPVSSPLNRRSGRPTTSPGYASVGPRAGGGVVASNASSPNNPLATHALMSAPHPGPAAARQGGARGLVLG